MDSELDLTPVQDLLTVGIKPIELAKELDELMVYFSQTLVRLQKNEIPDDYIYPDADNFIFRLRQLRDTFLLCSPE